MNPVQTHRHEKEVMEWGPEPFGAKADAERQARELERDDLFRTVGHHAVQIEVPK